MYWALRRSLETNRFGNLGKPSEQCCKGTANVATYQYGTARILRVRQVCLEKRTFRAIKPMNWLSKLSRTLARGITLISPSCKEAARLQSEAIARKLSLFERVGLRLHLFLCTWCRRYRSQLKFLRSASEQCEPHESPVPSQRLSPEACERIKQKLQSGHSNPL